MIANEDEDHGTVAVNETESATEMPFAELAG